VATERSARPTYDDAMAAVFVHGNPETPVIWEPLIAALDRDDTVTVQLPGFGCDAPQGWAATMDEYADWLVARLEEITADSGPVDLVGHDWGSHLGMRAISQRPELVTSWVCDSIGALHEDYVWHDLAQVWQTEGAGEEFFAGMLALSVQDRAAGLVAAGVPEPTAARIATVVDEEMVRCVLALYRSAAQPALARWGAEIGPAGTRPGLCIRATDDPYSGGSNLGPLVAKRLGARLAVLEGQGHWWMLTAPSGAAAVLEAFWSSR